MGRIPYPEIELNKAITQEDEAGAPRPYIQDAKMKKILIVGSEGEVLYDLAFEKLGLFP